EKYRISAQFREDGSDWFSKRLLQMLHLDPASFPATHAVRPMDVMAVAGHAVQQPRSATTLLGVLREYFGPEIPIDIEQCVEARVEIPYDQRNRLGVANTRLSDDLSLGDRVPDRACTFRVAVGPLDAQTFLDFLPPGQMTGRMRELIDLFNPDCLQTEVELRLDQASIPQCRLSSSESLLGWSTWLGNPPPGISHVRFLFKGWMHGRG
ncbi:MAG: type VI secretion system baseplate subunit TssG, partial [Planctomycetota bacterium]